MSGKHGHKPFEGHMHDYMAHIKAVEEDLEYYRAKRFEPRIFYLLRRNVVTFYDLLKVRSVLKKKDHFFNRAKPQGKNVEARVRYLEEWLDEYVKGIALVSARTVEGMDMVTEDNRKERGDYVHLLRLPVPEHLLGPHARTRAPSPAPGRDEDRTSYRAQLDYNSDRYGLQLERIGIGAGFRPDVGLVRRSGIVRDHALARFSPRPKTAGRHPEVLRAGVDRLHREHRGRAGIARAAPPSWRWSSRTRTGSAWATATYLETLPAPLTIGGVTLPVGSYQFDALRAGYNMGQQRALSANITLEHGTFYNGRKTTFSIARGRAQFINQLSVEPTYSINKVEPGRGPLHHAPAGHARHLHGHAPDVRERAGAVQLQHAQRLDQRTVPLGVLCRAASCSSSTTRTATRWCRTGPACRADRSS